MATDSSGEFENWVDPDILAYNEATGGNVEYDPILERRFKEFFETGWLSPEYDELREHWDPVIHDEDPYGRLYGKIALWSLVQLRKIQKSIK